MSARLTVTLRLELARCDNSLLYHRKVKESRMQAMHHRRMEGNALQYVFATYIYLRMPFHRGGGNCVADAAGHGGAAARQGISAYQVAGT